MRGRRTPTKIKALQGSKNVTRDLKNEVSFTAVKGLPAPPEHFGEIAKKLWIHLVDQLQQANILETTDLGMLGIYCNALETVEIKGETRNTDAKSFRMWRDAAILAKDIGGRFGFDPASRTKVASGKKKEEAKHPFETAVDGPKLKVAR